MKSLLYVAAAFMIGASIYGFVDYSRASRHREFGALYQDNEIKDPAAKDKTDAGITPVITKEEQPGPVKKEFDKKDTRAEGTNLAEKLVKKIRKKKSLSYKSFSRAPLKEEVIVITAKEQGKEQ
jgi:hypothetical protein